jgi:hypothetical protein
MNTDTVLEGGCLCGNIRYRSTKPPVFVTHCHCQRCRRHSGALFASDVGLPLDGFTWVRGEPAYWRSSTALDRGFCSICASAISNRYIDDPSFLVIPVGSLDDPERVTPEFHIMTESRVSWLKIDDDLPRYPRFDPESEHLDPGL